MKQDVVCIVSTLKMVYLNWMNIIKISQGIFRISRYAILTSSSSFACISVCRMRVLQEDPFIHSVHWGFNPLPLLVNSPLYIGFSWNPLTPSPNWTPLRKVTHSRNLDPVKSSLSENLVGWGCTLCQLSRGKMY